MKIGGMDLNTNSINSDNNEIVPVIRDGDSLKAEDKDGTIVVTIE